MAILNRAWRWIKWNLQTADRDYAVKISVKEYKNGNNALYALQGMEIDAIKNAPPDGQSGGASLISNDGAGLQMRTQGVPPAQEYKMRQMKDIFKLWRDPSPYTKISVVCDSITPIATKPSEETK
jgi:hypothetical protein